MARKGYLVVPLVIALSASTLAPRPASAAIFHDGPAWIQRFFEFYQQAQRWMSTARQYQREYMALQRQLARLKTMIYSFGVPSDQPLEKIAPDYMVLERCGSGGLLSKLANPASIVTNTGNLLETQRELCRQSQMLQNLKYNETVDFVNVAMPRMLKQIEADTRARNGTENIGDTEAASHAALQLANTFSAEYASWETRIRAYDAAIESIEQRQRTIAEIALKGARQDRVVGAVIRTKTLREVLGKRRRPE